MKCWCIIDLKGLYEFHFFGEKSLSRKPKSLGPTVFYDKRGDALLELFRLQTEQPGKDFLLFEAVAEVCQSSTVPGAWHLEQIGDDA